MEEETPESQGFNMRLEARLKNAELVKAREKLGMSAAECARQLGISYHTYLQYESMQAYPGENTQKRICNYFREKGSFLYEEDVFPESLKQFRPRRKYTQEATISPEQMQSLSDTPEFLLLEENDGLESLMEEEDQTMQREMISNALAGMHHTTRRIIEMKYGIGGKECSYEEIAKELNITPKSAMTLARVALTRLGRKVDRLKMRERRKYPYEQLP